FALNKLNEYAIDLKIPYQKNNRGAIEIQTTNLIQNVWNNVRKGKNRNMLALAVEKALAKAIAEVAILMADTHGISKIGLSGGVCYNQVIFTEFYRNIVCAGKKYTPIYHKQIPCGDGCISIGQVPLVQAKLT
ncbi:MAG: Kae1-like domain-containing protein, partial [Candidatus Hodarchaeales archaeon]